jgi:hypothetical protein
MEQHFNFREIKIWIRRKTLATACNKVLARTNLEFNLVFLEQYFSSPGAKVWIKRTKTLATAE